MQSSPFNEPNEPSVIRRERRSPFHFFPRFTACPDLSGPVGAIFPRTGLDCLINSKIHYSSRHIALNPDLVGAPYAVTVNP